MISSWASITVCSLAPDLNLTEQAVGPIGVVPLRMMQDPFFVVWVTHAAEGSGYDLVQGVEGDRACVVLTHEGTATCGTPCRFHWPV